MARSRNIKPGLFKNEILGEADPIYSLLFVGLWTIADKEGRLEYRPKKIRAEVFPYRFDLDVTLALDWLKHEAFITVYEFGEKSYIQINNWHKHQTPHHKETESNIPSIEYAEKVKQKQQDAQEQSKHDPTLNQEQLNEIASCPTDSLNLIPDSLNSLIEFERFWETYPRKTNRSQAEKAWAKLKPREDLFAQIKKNIEDRLQCGDWNLTNRKNYIPHPATYLNNARWEDELIPQGDKNTTPITNDWESIAQ